MARRKRRRFEPLDRRIEEVAADIVDAAIHVHRRTGPGLLEHVYQRCLAIELRNRGRQVELEVPVSFRYDGEEIEGAFRMDMIVDGLVVVEVKAVKELHRRHVAQLLTYLRSEGKRLGLLLNFHEILMKDGIRRVIC